MSVGTTPRSGWLRVCDLRLPPRSPCHLPAISYKAAAMAGTPWLLLLLLPLPLLLRRRSWSLNPLRPTCN